MDLDFDRIFQNWEVDGQGALDMKEALPWLISGRSIASDPRQFPPVLLCGW
jgi:hypothetical protein